MYVCVGVGEREREGGIERKREIVKGEEKEEKNYLTYRNKNDRNKTEKYLCFR